MAYPEQEQRWPETDQGQVFSSAVYSSNAEVALAKGCITIRHHIRHTSSGYVYEYVDMLQH